jgi:hypothetical protein
MLRNQIQRLDRLKADVERSVVAPSEGTSVHSALTETGRFARRPNYRNWSVNGTRPTSDRGVTFHFRHAFVTKGRHMSAGYTDETSAAAHQSYIERNGAVETTRIPDPSDDAYALFRATEDPDSGPGLATEERPISFGTLGLTKTERTEFWRKVEQVEGRRGRVQCRIIAELPHELDAGARELIARDFCRIFEEKSLPYWCSLHAPTDHNNDRNYHVHIAYYDRPATRMENGLWDFEVVETKRYANGVKTAIRPFKQNKDRSAQGKNWILTLRRRFADISNYHLSLAGVDKRYDPRSYKESGIEKQPTIHLGTKAFVAESHGIDTRPGIENTRREVSYRLTAGERNFRDLIRHVDHIERRISNVEEDSPEAAKLKNETLELVQTHRDLSLEGIAVWKKKESHEIALEAVGKRLGTRRAFLEKEINRLLDAPPFGREGDAWPLAQALHKESLLIDEASHDIRPFIDTCERIVSAQTRRLSAIDREQDALMDRILENERRLLSAVRGRELEGREETATQTQLTYELAFDLGDTAAARRPDKAPVNPTGDAARTAPDDAPADAAERSELDKTETAPVAEKTSFEGRDAGAPIKAMPEADPARTSTRTARPDVFEGRPTADSKPVRTDRSDEPEPRYVAQEPSREARSDAPSSDPESKAIRAILGSDKAAAKRAEQSFPDALPFRGDPTPEAVRAYERMLSTFTNFELRARAYATRDATDFAWDQKAKEEFRRGYRIICDVAKRRGLDLATGIHDPARATDPALARQHTDSETDPRYIDPRQKQRDQ